jgi:acetyltransferase-like isoleucine patch superfamily enzyme
MLLENIIKKLKNDSNYKWESSYSFRDLLVILWGRCWQIFRGMSNKFFFKKSKGLLFIGKRVKIKHAYYIIAGRNLILEDNTYINAISEEGIKFGDNVSIGRNSIIIGSAIIAEKGVGIRIGNDTGINAGAYLGGQGGIEIGNNVIVGPGVKIFSENHNFSEANILIKNQGVNREKVIIGNNCWIGAGVIILAGVTIGEGCVVAAGSVVTKSFPSNVIIAGIPGKVLKSRI